MNKNLELENKLIEKIRREHIIDDDSIDYFVRKIFERCPQELKQNIWEWCNDMEEYTDIKYCGLSINDMIKMGYDKEQFFRMIDVLNKINIIAHKKYDEGTIFTLYSTSSYRC